MSLVLVWVLKVVVLSGEFEILMGVGFGVVLLGGDGNKVWLGLRGE